MNFILNWILRGVFIAVGLGAAAWLVRWLVANWRSAEERWPLRVAIGMLVLAAAYAVGHGRLLLAREKLEEGRARYARYGDPRTAELRRAEVRGWIRDCTGEPEHALALYRARAGVVSRVYPLGAAGVNLVGGGADSVQRDFTVERLFAEQLRKPVGLLEAGQLHPAGTDLRLTLCSRPTAEAWRLLRQSGRPGAVVVQDVRTGALVAYAATGGPEDPPLGIKRYAPPGSVFKLALAALWWENELPDDAVLPCPARLQVTPRATISNYGGIGYGSVVGPVGMLVPSCNTAAVAMALQMREQLGTGAFVEAYRRFGFLPYADDPPRDATSRFWATDSERWSERMTPPPSRIRMHERTGRAEWAQLAIGQGPVDVTVIGVSRFIQAIGNGGLMLPPRLEWELVDEAGEDGGARVMSRSTARKLQAAMLAVVDQGTARSVVPLLEGITWDLGGKTGTAQIARAPDDGWFAGLVFDARRQPRYTVVVYLRGGGPGGGMPAAIAGQLTRVLARAGTLPVPVQSLREGVE